MLYLFARMAKYHRMTPIPATYTARPLRSLIGKSGVTVQFILPGLSHVGNAEHFVDIRREKKGGHTMLCTRADRTVGVFNACDLVIVR